MTNNDELAMKARIERALEDFTNGRACMHVPPLDTDVDMVLGDCLDMLAERDADKIQLAELESKLSQNESWSLAAQKYIAYLESQAKQLVLESDADKKRIAELEARAVSVKLPPCVDDLHGIGMVMSADAVIEALSAAGIKLEVGE